MKSTATGNPAKKTAAKPSTRSASFDFEPGKLEPWRVIEGEFGHPIGNRERYFHNNGEYNKQGEYYVTTLEGSADEHTPAGGHDEMHGQFKEPWQPRIPSAPTCLGFS